MVSEANGEMPKQVGAPMQIHDGTEFLAVKMSVPRVRTTAPSLIAAFDDYAIMHIKSPSRSKRLRSALLHLVRTVGHDDATRITSSALLSWQKKLLNTRTAPTVRDAYLRPVKAVLDWLVKEGELSENVAARLDMRVLSEVRFGYRPFTFNHASTILEASLVPQPGLDPTLAAARRWVPWICAYTGAAVNEITQLCRRDVRKEDGAWYFQIQKGVGRTAKWRDLPVHPHLIEQGLLDFVHANMLGGLQEMFFHAGDVRDDESRIRQYRRVGNHLTAWVRHLGVTDPNVSPSQGWQRRFRMEGRKAGVSQDVLDAIQGREPAAGTRRFLAIRRETMLREMLKMPIYEVEGR